MAKTKMRRCVMASEKILKQKQAVIDEIKGHVDSASTLTIKCIKIL